MTLSERDALVNWHPYTQMQTAGIAIAIKNGQGAYVFDENEKKYIDAISSWWVNTHGHAHPYIAEKVFEQLKKIEHVIFAGFTHEPAIELSERLLKLLPPNQKRIFYSDNGSTAVEVALKMVFQYWNNKGQPRNKIIAFKNAYHGDTFGAMSVSERNVFTKPFFSQLFEIVQIALPEKNNELDAIELFSDIIESQEIAGFIFEPLVQGAAGMQMYSPEILDQLIKICRDNSVITIADEVFTGFGRTGKMFASEYLQNKPDIFCLSKGLTGGTMALGVTSSSADIYDAFLSHESSKTFFHGHSFTANPVACSASLASLDLFEKEECWAGIKRISVKIEELRSKLAINDMVKNVRSLGTILALEINTEKETNYLNEIRHYLFPYFLERGIILRPLGNIIYLVPPYCISNEDLEYVYQCICECLIELTQNV